MIKEQIKPNVRTHVYSLANGGQISLTWTTTLTPDEIPEITEWLELVKRNFLRLADLDVQRADPVNQPEPRP